MDKPTSITAINWEYIRDYCSEQGQKDIDWLKNAMKTEVPPDKKGRPRKISFIELRKLFIQKYMPEMIPKPKPKKLTMYEEAERL